MRKVRIFSTRAFKFTNHYLSSWNEIVLFRPHAGLRTIIILLTASSLFIQYPE